MGPGVGAKPTPQPSTHARRKLGAMKTGGSWCKRTFVGCNKFKKRASRVVENRFLVPFFTRAKYSSK